MVERIMIVSETPGDSRTMFRALDDLLLGQNLSNDEMSLRRGERCWTGLRCRDRRKSSQANHRRRRSRPLKSGHRGLGTNRQATAF
jgi:hypothetical protein